MSVITIHGVPGSGKSATILELLALFKNTYRPVSIGAIARSIAKQYGYGDEKFDLFPEYARKNNIPYDELLDDELRKYNETDENVILDCRLGYFFVPRSYKVLLNTPLKIAAFRISKDPKRKGQFYNAVQAYRYIKNREESDAKKYQELYQTDYTLRSHFNLILSTTYRPAEIANDIYISSGIWFRQQKVLR